jgi:UDP-2-acetamido-3-amino-2,3-dideoxy-glucuronate N-acetyltransferase
MKNESGWWHESACIDEGAVIGEGARVWHFSHVCPQAVVGPRCVLGQNVYVGPGVSIGAGSKIQNNVSIYEGITLGESVFCGPSVVFTNVTNPRAAISRQEEYRPTNIQAGATLGANATILCGITIGTHAFIAAGAVVTRDVLPFALMKGVPARQVGWMSRHGGRLSLAVDGAGNAECPLTGTTYQLENGTLTELP